MYSISVMTTFNNDDCFINMLPGHTNLECIPVVLNHGTH